jgi:hypothetical protein
MYVCLSVYEERLWNLGYSTQGFQNCRGERKIESIEGSSFNSEMPFHVKKIKYLPLLLKGTILGGRNQAMAQLIGHLTGGPKFGCLNPQTTDTET